MHLLRPEHPAKEALSSARVSPVQQNVISKAKAHNSQECAPSTQSRNSTGRNTARCAR
jgi:hypothetical protein